MLNAKSEVFYLANLVLELQHAIITSRNQECEKSWVLKEILGFLDFISIF